MSDPLTDAWRDGYRQGQKDAKSAEIRRELDEHGTPDAEKRQAFAAAIRALKASSCKSNEARVALIVAVNHLRDAATELENL
jgi:hypothetical protein